MHDIVIVNLLYKIYPWPEHTHTHTLYCNIKINTYTNMYQHTAF